jgi:ribosomal protein S18 acetylase RimI-like enzyme
MPALQKQLLPEAALSACCPIRVLEESDKQAVLNYLSARPISTVIMAGWIHERGIVSEANRGTFYGYFDGDGRLDGVALIGRAAMFETQNERALQEFAELAKSCETVRMVMGEEEKMEVMLRHFVRGNRKPRLLYRDLLYEFNETISLVHGIEGLRAATQENLEQVVAAHAQMVLAETGVNPLEEDADGFRERCGRRIDRNKVWVLIRNGKLIFKADIVAETAAAFYLEGIWVDPAERSKGYGTLCFRELSAHLLAKKKSLCAFVDNSDERAKRFYRRSGARSHGVFAKIYL